MQYSQQPQYSQGYSGGSTQYALSGYQSVAPQLSAYSGPAIISQPFVSYNAAPAAYQAAPNAYYSATKGHESEEHVSIVYIQTLLILLYIF